MRVSLSPLPIDDVLPELARALAEGVSALLTAPPGAGKTTRVPLALMGAPWLGGRRIVMLEPRRLAARAAAARMAGSLGESVGQTVGYRIRHETKIGPSTRVEVVTEGILTRLLQHDPSLSEYGCVVFDEFHERSLHADVGLALCLDARRLFRPDLRVVVMSATLDCAGVATLLGDAPIVTGAGRSFPVAVRHLERSRSGSLDQDVAAVVRRALREESGSLLVFLPGMGEIRRVERRLQEAEVGAEVLIAPLHGELPQEDQDRAIAPAPPGYRKVVLATSIAETSLTIEDVRVVVDAGLLRVPRYDPRTGLTRLDTIRVTRDSADQRCGRAGRLAPGLCLRMWTSVDHQSLLPRRPPEILDADLALCLLELAVWGAGDPAALSWLDPPPAGALARARRLLEQLGALDAAGRVTAHGRRMAELGLHPRLAHMILSAMSWHRGSEACEVAALLSERDIIVRPAAGARGADLRSRLDLLRGKSAESGDGMGDRGAVERARRAAEQWRRQLRLPASSLSGASTGGVKGRGPSVGVLLAFAYPDRIAQRLPGAKGDPVRYRLSNGRGACFPTPDTLGVEEYLVVADLEGAGEWARIALAAPIGSDELDAYCGPLLRPVDLIEWDDRARCVLARRQQRLGELVLRDHGLPDPDPEAVRAALIRGIRQAGVACLRLTPECEQWRSRVGLLRRVYGADSPWPDVSDEALMAKLEDWLGPSLDGLTRLDQVGRLDVAGALFALLSWKERQDLDRLVPTHLMVPTGSRVRLDYTAGDRPVLAVRLQELFGCRETPRVAGGQVAVVIHLLSPAGRPVQVTQDLAGFWASSYFAVRKDLRGRYPKHHWPEDPLAAPPTRRAKRPGEGERA